MLDFSYSKCTHRPGSPMMPVWMEQEGRAGWCML